MSKFDKFKNNFNEVIEYFNKYLGSCPVDRVFNLYKLAL